MFNRRKNFFLSSILLRPSVLSFLGLIMVIIILIPLFKNITKQYEINQEISDLQKEINDFENKNSELKKTFEYLESDQFASEQARKNLNYKKEGEEVVVIKTVDINNFSSQGERYSVSTSGDNIEPSNPVMWWRYFFY